MGDAGAWALFGKKATELGKQLKGSKKASADDDDKHHEHKEDHKPVQVMHGQDNRDRTADELQQGEEVPQARIVAYSDSDEEDFNRNKWQAASASDSEDEHRASPVDHDTATVNVKQRQLIRKPPPGTKVSIEAAPSVAAVAGFCGQHVAPKIKHILVPQTAVRILVLGALQGTQPRAGQLLEQIAMLIGFPTMAMRWLGIKYSLPQLPTGLAAASHQLQALAVPAAVVQIAAKLWRLRLIRQRRRQKPAKSTAASQANLDSDPDTDSQTTSQHQQPPAQPQQPAHLGGGGGGRAAKAAQQYPMEVAEIKHRLKAAGAQLPIERFSNAELLRYGHACGLLKAQTADEKAEATEQAVDRVRLTLEWLQGQKAMTPMQVEHWDHLVRWQGRDAEGRPILVIRVAQACQECSSTRAELLGQVILSQVASAVDHMLGDEAGEAEQMVVVLDARQATTLQVTRKVNLIKRLALTLNQHYPARLHQLYLVDLPVVLKWVVAAVKPLLHMETRAKIQVCQLPTPVFPFPASILDFTSPLKRISLPSAAHTSGAQGTQSPSKGTEGKRAFRRSVSVPDLADRNSRSPRRRRDKAGEVDEEVQGLGGKGVKRRSFKKRTSSKAIAIQAHTQQLPITSLQTTSTSAVAALTLLFTFMAAIWQRLLGQVFTVVPASVSSSSPSSRQHM
ncbi:TPA: hypothetical protein ACH3X1_003011 [Trebouxia sp. C0004]